MLESAIGGSVAVPGAGNKLSYFSCISTINAQDACPGTISTARVTPSITAIGSYNANDTVNFSTLAAPFSLTEELNLTLTHGTLLNFSASSKIVLTPVPEPTSLALLRVGILGIGFAAHRKRSV